MYALRKLKTELSITGLIVFGTTTSLFAKIVYELEGPGLASPHADKFFRKPWAMTTVMFLGMSLCLPLSYYNEWLTKQEKDEAEKVAEEGALTDPLLGNGLTDSETNGVEGVKAEKGSTTGSADSEWRQVGMLAIPTAFDLIATVLMNIGLLSVTASVYQMMRGAEMMFAAAFAVLFLHRRLNRFHYGGIACCIAGIALVGGASLGMSEQSSATHDVSPYQMLLGMALIILSQAVQAAQVTFEDFFMTDLAIEPLKIVGYEGAIGTALMALVMLPLVYLLPGTDGEGVHENAIDTLFMIFHSGHIATILVIDMLALLAYNYAGMCVTGQLGAVFRTVLETMRTLFVWLVDLVLFYAGVGGGKLGEAWTAWSFLQLAGFAVLVCGTLIYRRGDDEEAREEVVLSAETSEAVGDAEPPLQPFAEPPSLPGTEGAADRPAEDAVSVPVQLPRQPTSSSLPISAGRSASLKSTYNIASYSSLRGSYAMSASQLARSLDPAPQPDGEP